MTASKPLEELAATWGAWSRRATITAAAGRAEAQGDHDGAAQLRALLFDQPAVTGLDALAAGHELSRLVAEAWPLVVDAALAETSWEEIGAATGRSAHRARTDHERGRGPGPAGRPDRSPAAGHGRWLTAAQTAARTNRSAWSVRRAAVLGELHGHQPPDRHGRPVAKSRWSFARTAVDAWAQGLDEQAQRAACGCPLLQAVPGCCRTAGGGR